MEKLAPSRRRTITLEQMAGWPIPGIGSAALVRGTYRPNGFEGLLNILPGRNVAPAKVIGHRSGVGGPFTLEVLLPEIPLSLLQGALAGTLLDDLRLTRAVLFLVPPGRGGTCTVPTEVAQVLNRHVVTLPEGTSLWAIPKTSGSLQSLLARIGASTSSASMTGKLDPALLAIPNPQPATITGYVDSLDLSLALGPMEPSWRPTWLGFANPVLRLKGSKGTAAITVSVDATVKTAGKTLPFTHAVLSKDPKSGLVTLTSEPTPVPENLAEGIHAGTMVTLAGSVGVEHKSFTLSGSQQVKGALQKFQLDLSGNGPQAILKDAVDAPTKPGGIPSATGLAASATRSPHCPPTPPPWKFSGCGTPIHTEHWNDKQGKNGVIKITCETCQNNKYHITVFRNDDWNGNGSNWSLMDEFVLSQSKNIHDYECNDIYPPYGVRVKCSIQVDYSKRMVHSKGVVDKPPPEPFSKSWDENIFSIPAKDFDVITTDAKDPNLKYVETTPLWSAFCSDYPCGPWVSFGGYAEGHSYMTYIQNVGWAIVQLWKGYCPRENELPAIHWATRWVFDHQFPGGLGAEVGVYVPRGFVPRTSDKLPMAADRWNSFSSAATGTASYNGIVFGQGDWVPLINANLTIGFTLTNPANNQPIVVAEPKIGWWRTKWMTGPSYEYYKKKNPHPNNDEDFILDFTINGIKQPTWKRGWIKYQTGFNGVWQLVVPKPRNPHDPRPYVKGPDVIQICTEGDLFQISWTSMDPIVVKPGGGVFKMKDGNSVRAVLEGNLLTLFFDKPYDFNSPDPFSYGKVDKIIKIQLNSDQTMNIIGFDSTYHNWRQI